MRYIIEVLKKIYSYVVLFNEPTMNSYNAVNAGIYSVPHLFLNFKIYNFFRLLNDLFHKMYRFYLQMVKRVLDFHIPFCNTSQQR